MPSTAFVPRGAAGCGLGLVVGLLALGLTFASGFVQCPADAFCGGRLGAGFPAAFVCEASGESPLSSVGRIDWADAGSVSLQGSAVDILFYAVLGGSCAGLSRPNRSRDLTATRAAARAMQNPPPARNAPPRRD